MIKFTNQTKTSQKGVSLLLTALVLSVILAIAIAFSLVAFREIQMTRGAKNSFVAIYAADAGIEKMLHRMFQVPGAEHPTSTGNVILASGASYFAETICGGAIRSFGTHKGAKRAIETRYKPPKFAFITADLVPDLQIADVTDPVCLFLVADSGDLVGHGYGVVVQDNYAYLANLEGGLMILDVSNPSEPVFVDQIDTPPDAMSVAVSDSYAYVANYDTLEVIRLAPLPRQIVNSLAISALDIVISSDRAYVSGISPNTLTIVDISNPEVALSIVAPSPCDNPGGNGPGITFDSSTNEVFIADESDADGNEVIIINPSDCSMTEYDLPSPIAVGNGLDFTPTHLYVAGDDAVYILERATMSIINSIPSGDAAAPIYNVTVSEPYLYIANGAYGIRIFNVTDPSSPQLEGEIVWPEWNEEARDIFVR